LDRRLGKAKEKHMLSCKRNGRTHMPPLPFDLTPWGDALRLKKLFVSFQLTCTAGASKPISPLVISRKCSTTRNERFTRHHSMEQ
jgi:hypothetical protein